MTKDLIKLLISEYQSYVSGVELIPRDVEFVDGLNYVFVGLRHAGKSYLMFQRIAQLIEQGHKKEEILYFNFEDDRIDSLEVKDLDLIKTCYEEMYDSRPIFFLDEIQLVDRWEKFARRLADQKYQVYITGSNAKMLSSEIATTLGGRYMIYEVYPYSLKEYLKASGIDILEKNAMFVFGKQIVKLTNTYFQHGGLPETVGMKETRSWMSNLFSKIFFGDLVARYRIRNDYALRVMIRKMAESVKQPLSYNRIASIVSSTGKKLSTDAAIDYIGYMTDTWLILPYENLYGKLQDKETNRKYYFTDNGLLHLFLVDANTSLLENIVAVTLRRKYGDGSYFWNSKNAEVDFVVPEEKLAVQVSYSMTDANTSKREIDGLIKLHSIQPISRMIVVTMEEENLIEKDGFHIELVPLWKWLLKF
ncbi:ATP-binding protein [Mediterranea massiliensis]|uniref:ATP-binding protein n=2 Tax=Mediterranea TaxID=1926659 RepID=UPI0025A39385|nr:ATP-binding protein [Mediterranea massiliensis]MDM8122805.1 ATP-binding protein [Mediterranea massiliensis]MDM8198884.1 ATP-binding protein [Mediterranea massiliensis]